MKVLKLAYIAPIGKIPATYRVISAKNSVVYYPGEILSKPEVEDLCRSVTWDVLILPPEANTTERRTA